MAATMQKRAIRGFMILTCALFVNLIGSASAGHSSDLSYLYKKVAEKHRPVVLFLDNADLNRDHEDYRAVSRETSHHKNFPYEYLQKLLEGHSRESYSNYRKPQNYNYQSLNLQDRKFTNRYRDSKRGDDDRKYRYKNDKDRQYDSRDDSQDSRQDDRKYRDLENRNKNSRYRSDNDRRVRNRNDRDRQDYRQDDREYRSLDNRDDRNQYSRYRERKDQQYDERKDRYRSRDREDRKDRNRYYKERPRLRTGNQEQVQSDQQDRNRKDQVERGQYLERKDREQDRSRQRPEGVAGAQIPIVRSLLRSLRCEAKDECEDACDNDNSCEDECAQEYECETEPPKQPKCTGSTKGETLVTEDPGCPRC